MNTSDSGYNRDLDTLPFALNSFEAKLLAFAAGGIPRRSGKVSAYKRMIPTDPWRPSSKEYPLRLLPFWWRDNINSLD